MTKRLMNVKVREIFLKEYNLIGKLGDCSLHTIKFLAACNLEGLEAMVNHVLFIKTYRLIYCAKNVIFQGYYEVGMSLLRNIYENNLLMLYFKKNRTASIEWISGKRLAPRYLRNQLGENNWLYKYLSTLYSHSENSESLKTVICDVLDSNEKRDTNDKLNLVGLEVLIEPEFHEEKCRQALYTLIILWWQLISAVFAIFQHQISSSKKINMEFIILNKKFLEFAEKIKQDIEKNRGLEE